MMKRRTRMEREMRIVEMMRTTTLMMDVHELDA